MVLADVDPAIYLHLHTVSGDELMSCSCTFIAFIVGMFRVYPIQFKI